MSATEEAPEAEPEPEARSTAAAATPAAVPAARAPATVVSGAIGSLVLALGSWLGGPWQTIAVLIAPTISSVLYPWIARRIRRSYRNKAAIARLESLKKMKVSPENEAKKKRAIEKAERAFIDKRQSDIERLLIDSDDSMLESGD